jgi:alpha-mannosidase
MIAEMDSWPVFPNFRMNTSEAYFRLLEQRGDQWPTLEGELNYEFPGCYSSQSLIKRTNRLAEWALVRCEWAACLAEAAGLMAYPAEKIVESWRRTLFGHFHDILPGSCVAAARDYHAGQYQLTAAQTGIDQTRAYRALAAEMDLRFAAAGRPERPARAVSAEPVGFGGGVGRDSEDASVSSAGHAGGDERYFVVFNPSPFPRSEVVRLATWDSELGDVQKRNYTAVFPDGGERPVQRIDKGMYWGHEYIDLAVPVRVPAGGWTAVALRDEGLAADIKHIDSGYDPAKDPRDDSAASTLRTGATERHQRFGPAFSQERWLENEHLRAEFDNETGCLRRLLDKRTGLELIDPDQPAGCEYLIERPGPMSSWRIFDPRRRQFPLEMVSFEPLMCGMWEQTPWQVGYVCQQRAGETTVRTTWRLEEGSDRLEVQIDCDWRQRGGPEAGTPSLRFRLPVAVDGACLACECPSGSVVRRDDPNQEVPSQTWVDVRGETPSGQPAGMAVYNDACYSWRLGEGVLTATLLRSSYQPDPLPEFGPKRFRLALAPHGTAPNAAELMRRGAAFNQPLQVVTAEEHEGSLPARSGEMLSVEPENVLLTACKRAEDGRGWVLRLLETAGRETAATVRLGSDLPGEVVSAVETDLLERPRDGGTAAAAEDGFTVTLAPFAIASVRLERK